MSPRLRQRIARRTLAKAKARRRALWNYILRPYTAHLDLIGPAIASGTRTYLWPPRSPL